MKSSLDNELSVEFLSAFDTVIKKEIEQFAKSTRKILLFDILFNLTFAVGIALLLSKLF